MLLNNHTDPIVDLTRCNILTDPSSADMSFVATARYIGPRQSYTSRDSRRINLLVAKMMRSIKDELESHSSSSSFSSFSNDLERVFNDTDYVQYSKPSTYLNIKIPTEEFVYTDYILERDPFDSELIYNTLVYMDNMYDEGLSYMPLLNSLESYTDNELSMDHILLYDLETEVKTLNPKL